MAETFRTDKAIPGNKFFVTGGFTGTTVTMVGRHRLPSFKKAGQVAVSNVARQDRVSPFLTLTDDDDENCSPTTPTQADDTGSLRTTPSWPIRYSTDKTKTPSSDNIGNVGRRLSSLRSRSRSSVSDGKQQAIIDAGQRDIGPTVCDKCGMLYAKNDPEDVALHQRMHGTVATALKFTGWKKERVVRQLDDGRILLVLPEDPRHAQKKVENVLDVVNRSLGFGAHAPSNKDSLQVYFFISTDNKIVGFAMAEPIRQACRSIVQQNETETDDDGHEVPCCSDDPEKASCGINRIWTSPSHRRRHIATRLLDCIRHKFYYGCVIPTDEIAFSAPTRDGRRLAENYCGSPRFLIYG